MRMRRCRKDDKRGVKDRRRKIKGADRAKMIRNG